MVVLFRLARFSRLEKGFEVGTVQSWSDKPHRRLSTRCLLLFISELLLLALNFID